MFSSMAIAKPKTIFSGIDASEKMTVIFSACMGSGIDEKQLVVMRQADELGRRQQIPLEETDHQ